MCNSFRQYTQLCVASRSRFSFTNAAGQEAELAHEIIAACGPETLLTVCHRFLRGSLNRAIYC